MRTESIFIIHLCKKPKLTSFKSFSSEKYLWPFVPVMNSVCLFFFLSLHFVLSIGLRVLMFPLNKNFYCCWSPLESCLLFFHLLPIQAVGWIDFFLGVSLIIKLKVFDQVHFSEFWIIKIIQKLTIDTPYHRRLS